MGASLVVQVLASWSHLSDRAFRVLVRMAVTALDKPQNGQSAAIYHAGRDLLAMSLRSEGSVETRYRAVKRAVAELTEAGAIEHLATGWAGQNAVYRLTLERSKSAAEPNRMGGSSDPPMGGSSDPPMGGQMGPEWGVPATPPRNHKELQEELAEEDVGLSMPTSHPPRVTAPSDLAPVVQLFGQKPKFAPVAPRRPSRAEEAIAEAAAKRAQAVAEHRARQAAEEIS